MNSHPSYPILSTHLERYPCMSGCLFQVYNDLSHAQRWKGLEIIELPDCSRVALRGERPETKLSHFVVPCSLSECLSLGWLSAVFKSLGDTPELHLAIANDDSSIVYYRISKGIIKPPS